MTMLRSNGPSRVCESLWIFFCLLALLVTPAGKHTFLLAAKDAVQENKPDGDLTRDIQ